MNIDYISDLHINHYVPFIHNQIKWQKRTVAFVESVLLIDNPSDILIIAGDFSEQNQQTIWTIETFAKYYKNVIIVFGNHDLYLLSKNQEKKYKNDSRNRTKQIVDYFSDHKHIHVLDNEIVTINGKTFAGSKLWYNPKTEDGKWFYNNISNDSQYIKIKHTISNYKPLHETDMAFYQSLIDSQTHVDVMITHVPPIVISENTDDAYNECYTSPVPSLIAPIWVCGHQHINYSFEKDGTQFHMNPMGYPNERTTKKIKTMKVDD